MTVLRVVADLHADRPQELAGFYTGLFELDVAMDLARLTRKACRL